MFEIKMCRGRVLWIAVGIMALALLLAGGAGAATLTASGGADYVLHNHNYGGLPLWSSNGKTINNGYFNNPKNASLGNSINYWTTTKQVGTSSVGNSEQWNRTFGGTGYDWANSVQQTSDGGYLFAGGTTSYGSGMADAWLVKTNSNGNQQWSKTFGGIDDDYAISVQMTSDSGYILAGVTNSSGNGWFDAWLIKTDASGNQQWSRTFGGIDDDIGYSVQQTSDGGYVLAGFTWSYGNGNDEAWLIKTDSSGNLQWSRTFGGTGYDYIYSVQQTSDSGYILAGGTSSYGAGSDDVWLIKTDSSGNPQWSRTFGGTRSDWAEAVQKTSDGGYILAGLFNSTINRQDAWLIKTDAYGNQQWNRTFGGFDNDGAFDVNQTSDGYILTGETFSYGAGRTDAWLIKTDVSGNEQWNRTFGGTDFDAAYSLRQTSDGGYILEGETYSYGAGNDDAWLIKVSSEAGGSGSGGGGNGFADDVALLQSNGWWAIKYNFNRATSGTADKWTVFGDGSAQPVVGDFSHTGTLSDVALLQSNGWWAIKYDFNNATNGGADKWIAFGDGTAKPVVGDLDHDGFADDVALLQSNGWWAIKYDFNSATNSTADKWIPFGSGTAKPVVGDFNGDGFADDVALLQSNGWWAIKYDFNSATNGSADKWVLFGDGSAQPVVGNFNTY